MLTPIKHIVSKIFEIRDKPRQITAIEAMYFNLSGMLFWKVWANLPLDNLVLSNKPTK
jgi:hypothetical protein